MGGLKGQRNEVGKGSLGEYDEMGLEGVGGCEEGGGTPGLAVLINFIKIMKKKVSM